MSIREDSKKILDVVYNHHEQRPTAETISSAVDLSSERVTECLRYLDDKNLIVTNNPMGEGIVVWDVTTEGIDHIEGSGEWDDTEKTNQNTIGDINSERVTIQQNIGSDNPSQIAEGDENNNFTINTQAGLADLMSPIFKWLISKFGFKYTSAIGILSLLSGSVGFYWTTQTTNSFIWSMERILLSVTFGVFLIIGLTFALGFFSNRCRGCGAFFSFGPVGNAEITNRQERSDEPDLLKVEQSYECSECGRSMNKSKNVLEHEL